MPKQLLNNSAFFKESVATVIIKRDGLKESSLTWTLTNRMTKIALGWILTSQIGT